MRIDEELMEIWLNEVCNRRVSPRFCPETEVAGTHILANVPRHLGLLVIPGHQFSCLPVSGVSCDRGVVAEGYNLFA